MKEIIGYILVIAGWIVVHHLSAKRDKEKSKHEMIYKTIDSLIDMVDKTLQEAHKYHTSIRDQNCETKIKMQLDDLQSRVRYFSLLIEENSIGEKCRKLTKNYWRQITGSHFEDEHETPLDNNDERIQLIAKNAVDLKNHLLFIKYKQIN